VLPVGAFGDDEPVVGGRQRVVVVVRLFEGRVVVLVPDVGGPFEEQQREDVLLVVARVAQHAQQRGGAPQVGFELALRQSRHRSSHPPSLSPRASCSSAARASARAALKALTASGSGGIESSDAGITYCEMLRVQSFASISSR